MVFTTKNSGILRCIRGETLRLTIGCVLAVQFVLPVMAATNYIALAGRTYDTALEAWRQDPHSVTGAVAVARAAAEYSDILEHDKERAEIATRGIAAARDAVARDSGNAAAHYWLGMNLGELARTKSIGALSLVKEVADELFKARDLDEKVDYAGPSRSLGMLFRDAPGWPTSLGDKKKARQYLLRAVELAPEFPENQICLLESYEKWGERNNFERQLTVAENALKEAKAKFTGPEWAYSWSDWAQRMEKMRSRAHNVGRSAAPKGGAH